jgi:hypothetical protein
MKCRIFELRFTDSWPNLSTPVLEKCLENHFYPVEPTSQNP